MNKGFKKLITIALLLSGWFSFSGFVYGSAYGTAESTDSINVQMAVPTVPGEPGPEAGDAAPIISNVVTTTAATSATVVWIVTDDVGLSSVTFNYSTDMSYSLTTTTVGTYQVNLINLAQDTVYYFKITAIDTATNVTVYVGSLKTPSDSVKSIKIYAKPEKRVSKTSGNLALDATVLFYDPATLGVIHTLNISLDKTGSTTLYNVVMPNGTNLQAILKGQSHLARKIIGVNILNGQNIILDFTESGSTELLAGDVQGTGLKDNFVDILDVSAENMSYNDTGLNEDLNRDGIVDVLDLSVTLVNFNKAGVPIPL